jgi:ABC-type multidrug transport system ATPase subunit
VGGGGAGGSGGGGGAEGGGDVSDPPNSSTTTRMKRFVSKVAYVKQDDIFFVHLTVRDQLAYTAFLRLPQGWTRVSKLQKVDRILQLLRLTHVQHSPIQCLSGGEKKRVNIGTELLTNPSCLLLDEPTSGLDSTNAVALVRLLQQLARQQQKTVIMSIHQPSSGMFLSFDSLVLLAAGYVVYFGTPRQSIAYLKDDDNHEDEEEDGGGGEGRRRRRRQRFSSNLACPEGYNAADHWMDLLVTNSDDDEDDDEDGGALEEEHKDLARTTNGENVNGAAAGGSSMMLKRHRKSGMSPTSNTAATSRIRPSTNKSHLQSTRQQLIEAWDDEAVAKQVDSAVREQSTTITGFHDAMDNSSHHENPSQKGGGGGSSSSNKLSDIVTKKYNTSWWVQYRVLVHRAMKNSRSAIFTPLNMIKSAVLGIVAGLLWFQLEYTEKAVHDHTSYVFFTMTYWVFDSMFTSLLAFPSERQVILKVSICSVYNEVYVLFVWLVWFPFQCKSSFGVLFLSHLLCTTYYKGTSLFSLPLECLLFSQDDKRGSNSLDSASDLHDNFLLVGWD